MGKKITNKTRLVEAENNPPTGNCNDVLDRDIEALETNIAEYRALFENMTEVFLLGEPVLDPHEQPFDIRLLDVNKSWESWSNFSRMESIGKTYRELFSDLSQEMIQICARAALTGERITFKVFFPHNRTWARGYACSPLKGKFAAVFSDITERKQADEALKKSERDIKFILKNSIDAVYQRNIQTNRYEYISPVVKNLTGYSSQEMTDLGLDEVTEMIHPDDLPALMREIELTHKGEKEIGSIEYRFRKKTGGYGWLADRFGLIRDHEGRPLYLVGIVRDVTQSKQIEESLCKSGEQFRLYFNLGLVGMAIESPSGEWLEFNDKLCEILGYTREELMKLHWESLTHPDDIQKDLAQFNLLSQGKINQYRLEKRYIHKSGEIIHAIISVGCSRLPDGKIRSIFVLIADNTEQKRAEEALARYRDELEIQVSKRTEQLQEAYDEIIQSQEALKVANENLRQYSRMITQVQEDERKRIAYELHDDTAQYLSILKMQIGVLVNSDKIQSPEIKEKLRFLERDADRAFNDVRRYSHELRPVVLEHQGLAAALEQMADDYNRLGDFFVEVDIEGLEPDLSEAVKLGLFRIAQEALNNTRKHARATRSFISLTFSRKNIKMRIKDNGIGFDVRKVETRFNHKGNLGLISIRERANLIGAFLDIESSPGQGTTVSVELPL